MKKILELIAELEQEATSIQTQGRALTIEEMSRLRSIHQAIPSLHQAANFFPAESIQHNLITYKIVSDLDRRLKNGARTACNFWNHFVIPRSPIVLRLSSYYADTPYIATANIPWMRDGVMYGEIIFNEKFLTEYSANEIAGTIVHELGHTLGYGWEDWMGLFDPDSGQFHEHAIAQLGSLRDMYVETEGLPGTIHSHWDEGRFGSELMTGYKNFGEYVLPVTIDMMGLLGHRVKERLSTKTDLDELLDAVSQVQFTRQQEAKSLDLDFYQKTELFENIPHRKS